MKIESDIILTCNSQSKAQPKSAAATKVTANGASTRGGRARGRAGRRAGRPKRKTAEELDEEMVDYFDANATTNGAAADGAVNGTAQAAVNDDGMDEISVGTHSGSSLVFANARDSNGKEQV